VPRIALITAAALAALFAAACARGGGATPGPDSVTVRAEVLEADAPVDVETTAVRAGQGGTFAHEVRVTWRGEEGARLDDARFAHHVEAGGGHLVIAGRGCGANWDAERREVMLVCTADLRLIVLEPGETHDYPVVVYPEVESLRLRPGTYVVEEVVHWWQPDDTGVAPIDTSYEGVFTIRLTYEVQ
jgi:hypothetical protein